ncbi:MAG TPA: hypothetical protein VD908_03345 [Cytophagales bacterium]|nr:hypothetical protein [Cytophagales bacterium]
MESEDATIKAQEEGEFKNISDTRQPSIARTGDEASRLNAAEGEMVGPAISLKVSPGDRIKMQVFAKYTDGGKDYSGVVDNISSALTNSYTTGLVEAQKQIIGNALAGVPRLFFTPTSTVPRAYLNYMFFNKYMVYDQSRSGFKPITGSAATAFQELYLETLIEEEGFLYIYVANESSESVDVFFDDLKITHIGSTVKSNTDYYLFGLTIAGLSGESAGTNPNKYLYNGKELQDDKFGGVSFAMYDYGARMYDPCDW